MNDQELLAYSDEHVAYEVERFFWLAALLTESQTWLAELPEDDALRLNHALIEAFALHLRNLLEFLHDEKGGHYMNARQYCPPGSWNLLRKDTTPGLEQAWRRVNQEIAHLTDKRKPPVPAREPWPFKEIAADIRNLVECLVERATAGRLSPKVLKALEARPEATGRSLSVGLGPSSAAAQYGMEPVGTTGTSRFLSEGTDPPKERK